MAATRNRLLSTSLIVGSAAIALAVGVFATTSATGAPAPVAGARVDNFVLAAQDGVGYELYYYKSAPAVVIVSTQLGDKPSEKAVAALQAMRAAYEAKGVVFLALNSSTKDSNEAIRKGAKDSALPVLDDDLQLVGRALGVTQTGEVFVVNPKTWTVAYHGAADSTAAALDAVLAGAAPKAVTTKVKGTAIAFPDRQKQAEFKKISYAKDVAPILANKCVTCHTKGGVAPFDMNSYEVVKGFAPMIRESIRTKRMPPFHSDPHGAKWANDMTLSADQIRTVVNWVEGGAPRGEGEDPLAKPRAPLPEWPLGTPDTILELPAFNVPATGIVDYTDLQVKNPHADGRYIQAMTYKAGAVETVHHIIGTWRADGGGRGEMGSINTAGYGPGSESKRYPIDTGPYIPGGGAYNFQMHYTTTGKAATDKTVVGIYFTKAPPKNILRQLGVMDFSIEIPASEGRHHERSHVVFPADVTLYGVRPHAHYRGYSTKLTLVYPDGKEKLLLNQPRYDFGWQREYTLDALLPVPKGSKIIADYVFDNSTANPWNPDPKHNVTFGEQTMDEMLFTYIYYYIDGETREKPKDDVQRAIQSSISFSALDDNLDGKVQLSEVRGARMASVKANFATLDKNGDGALDKSEFPGQSRAISRLADGDLTATAQ